jgi:hypothetical protein
MLEHRGLHTSDAGAVITPHRFTSITGEVVDVPDPDLLVHLQFRRFAGCPVCNLHLRSVVRRHDEITAAGIREIVVFHSTTGDLLTYEAELPFAVLADPGKRLYVEFGVESTRRTLLDPRAWPSIVRGIARSAVDVVRRGHPSPPLNPPGGRFGQPADFLIAPDGHVLASHYGSHADDQWSIDELLHLTQTAMRGSPPARPAPGR